METQSHLGEIAKTAVANVFNGTSLPEPGIFRKEGEYWTVGYRTRSFRLKDTKGVAYVAHLLRHRGTKFHARVWPAETPGHSEAEAPSRSRHGLPAGEEDLERAGIHITGLG